MVELNLDGDALKTVAAQAILDQLTDEKKEDLIRQSVINLITPKEKTHGYGRATSTALQDAFDIAVAEIAREVLRDTLQEDSDVMNQIQKVVQDGITEAFSEGAPETSHAIAGVVKRVFAPRD